MSHISFPATLLVSFESILTAQDDTNWALYTYDKGGNELKVAETGGKRSCLTES